MQTQQEHQRFQFDQNQSNANNQDDNENGQPLEIGNMMQNNIEVSAREDLSSAQTRSNQESLLMSEDESRVMINNYQNTIQQMNQTLTNNEKKTINLQEKCEQLEKEIQNLQENQSEQKDLEQFFKEEMPTLKAEIQLIYNKILAANTVHSVDDIEKFQNLQNTDNDQQDKKNQNGQDKRMSLPVNLMNQLDQENTDQQQENENEKNYQQQQQNDSLQTMNIDSFDDLGNKENEYLNKQYEAQISQIKNEFQNLLDEEDLKLLENLQQKMPDIVRENKKLDNEKRIQISKALTINEQQKNADKDLQEIKKCVNCKSLYSPLCNDEESCQYHDGQLRFYSCLKCGADEYYNCCNQCIKCSKGCQKRKHAGAL